jgi:hypothetical protein
VYFKRAVYIMVTLLTVHSLNPVLASEIDDLKGKNTELKSAFDLMVRQLAEQDMLIDKLRSELSQVKAGVDLARVQALGCPVEQVVEKVAAESFIYDREKTLLNWLNVHVSTCTKNHLDALKRFSSREALNQSGQIIVQELDKRNGPNTVNVTTESQLITQSTSCSVERATQIVDTKLSNSERDTALLSWLKEQIDGCTSTNLKALEGISYEAVLEKSSIAISEEIELRKW